MYRTELIFRIILVTLCGQKWKAFPSRTWFLIQYIEAVALRVSSVTQISRSCNRKFPRRGDHQPTITVGTAIIINQAYIDRILDIPYLDFQKIEKPSEDIPAIELEAWIAITNSNELPCPRQYKCLTPVSGRRHYIMWSNWPITPCLSLLSVYRPIASAQ